MNTYITGRTKFYSQTQNKEYIETLRRNPPYTQEEEIEAFKRLKNGDETALNDIMLHNQRWIYSLAKEFARDEIEVMDYVQEGNLGMLEAIQRYDVERGLKFITFAVWYIRREMNAHLNKERDSIAKTNNAKLARKVEKIKNDFLIRNGYKPSMDDIIETLDEKYGIVVKDERDLYDLEISSISDKVNDDSTIEESDDYIKATSTNDSMQAKEETEYFQELVMPILKRLDEESQDIIKKIYHIGETDNERKRNAEYTFSDVCAEYKRSEDEVRGMEARILQYMRQQFAIREHKIKVINELKKALKVKKLTENEKVEIINRFSLFFDSCFNENDNVNYRENETIEKTVARIEDEIKKYLQTVKNISKAV